MLSGGIRNKDEDHKIEKRQCQSKDLAKYCCLKIFTKWMHACPPAIEEIISIKGEMRECNVD